MLVDYKRLFAGIAASYACTVVTYHHDVVDIGPIPISVFFTVTGHKRVSCWPQT